MAIEQYKDGIVFSSGKHQFTSLSLKDEKLITHIVELNSIAADVGFCLKFMENGSFYSFNDSGLHYYDAVNKKTYTEQLFDITNCGLSISSDSKKLVVGDFVGNVYIFSIETGEEIKRTFIGPPIRAISWAEEVDTIFIGTTDGTLSVWNHTTSPEVEHLKSFNCSINCIRTGRGLAIIGNSIG